MAENDTGRQGEGHRRRLLGWIALWLAVLAMTAWEALFLLYSPLPAWLGNVLAPLLAVGMPVALARIRPRRLAVRVTVGLLGLPLLYWFALRPSNDRDWQPDVAVLPSATIDGEQVTIHNIRNCDYRTAEDFDVRHYDRTFDLGDLESIDLFFVDWGLRNVAHMMLSFGFGD
ncbi:MAG: hypothetical protein HN380_20430, partial [Victivallales bacterium]|nr:hypothetical protein [Victivallales bacterium]